jgi:hypothetical protein
MKKNKAVPRAKLERELNVYKQAIAALVVRLGGYVRVTAAEIDGGADDRVEFSYSKAGFEARVTRRIVLAGPGLN